MYDVNKIFTQRFNEVLKISGLKQNDVAAKCNLSKQAVTEFKSGRGYPSIQTLALLCVALDCPADYLLGLVDDWR